MFISPVLVLRILQGVLAFIAMAIGATVANVFNDARRPDGPVPNAVIYFTFTAVFTLLVTVPYTILAPRFFQKLAHPLAMLGAEAGTAVLWLGGFAAVADRLRRSNICEVGACASARGCVVTGVLEFLLFAVTAFFAFSHVFFGGRFNANKPSVKEVQGTRVWDGAERV